MPDDVTKSLQLKPVGLLLAEWIQGAESDRPLWVLFDAGSDAAFIA